MRGHLIPVLLAAGCGGAPAPPAPPAKGALAEVTPAEVTPASSPTSDAAVAASAGPASSDPPAARAPATDELDPDVVATMTRPTLVRRVLPDGTSTHAGTEVLVVRRDGWAEIRDVDVRGMLIRRAMIGRDRARRVAALLARPGWAKLAPERGTPVPDGPSYEIAGNHHRITRFDALGDEPLARQAVALLKAIWNDVDR